MLQASTSLNLWINVDAHNVYRAAAQALISSLGKPADLLAAHESFPHSPGLIAVASRLTSATTSGTATPGSAASASTGDVTRIHLRCPSQCIVQRL